MKDKRGNELKVGDRILIEAVLVRPTGSTSLIVKPDDYPEIAVDRSTVIKAAEPKSQTI